MTATLQWGRAYKSAEFRNLLGIHVRIPSASMGPRLQERGVQQPHFNCYEKMFSFNGAALTRARSYSRRLIEAEQEEKLQWGRAYKSAELDAR